MLPEPRIVSAHDAFVVLNKPSGMLSVPGKPENFPVDESLVAWLKQHFRTASILTVHRLDQGTSGLMVYALNAKAQSQLSKQFQARTVEKHYIAMVKGKPPADAGSIDAPIEIDFANRPLRRIDWANGKASLTHYTLRSYDAASDTSLIDLAPQTGRTHQLRVHLAHIGCPILGDHLYNAAPPAGRLMLHALRLAFTHPTTGERLRFELPAEFA